MKDNNTKDGIIFYQRKINNVNKINKDDGSNTENSSLDKPKSKENPTKNTHKCNLKIIIPVIILLAVGTGVALFFVLRSTPPSPPIKSKGLEPLEMQLEYKIKTNKNDLKRIYITQKYYEEMKINGITSSNFVDRKTNYDIYIIDEIPATEEEQLFYNKTFLCSISISSECVSTNDEYCIPRKLVDLNNQDYSHIRNLNELNSLENFPLPLCYFNLTDNNVITSIKCHKKLPESKVNSIVLDLYFFRPPGIKRMNTEILNITLNTYKEGENEVIRETNGGMCNIESAFNSLCTTEVNTTKDSEGNLIAYYEVATTNLTTNEDNFYIKTKYTNLLDKTSDRDVLNPEKYNQTLNKLYYSLKDHMKVYEQFSLDNFKELYNESKGIPYDNNKNENSATKRSLSEEIDNDNYEVGADLFKYKHYGGVQVILNLKDDPGYHENMIASSILSIDTEKSTLANLKFSSDFFKAIQRLKLLIEAGNKLASLLYDNINEHFDKITSLIALNITSLNNMVEYKELSDIFDYVHSLDTLKTIPYEIIGASNNLVNELEKTNSGIENNSMKNKLRFLNEYIYKFIKQSHTLLNKVSNNLQELGHLIESPKELISQITNYYMNHTSSSYASTIEKAKDILDNYYINENKRIIPEIEKLMEIFENSTFESLFKPINLVNKISNKLENNVLQIENSTEENYAKIKSNLQNSNNYISKIIELVKKKISNEMDLKDGYFTSKYDIELYKEEFNEILEKALEVSGKIDDNEYIDKLFDEIMIEFRKEFISIIKNMEILRNEKFIVIEKTLDGEEGSFTPSEQEKIFNELKQKGTEILIKVKNENTLFLNTVNEKINKFLNENKEILLKIISNLNHLFSEDSLENLANSYKNSFNKHLDEFTNRIKKNENLSNEYFDGMVNLMNDNKEVVRLLENYPVNKEIPSDLPRCTPEEDYHCVEYTGYEDKILSKKISKGYTSKYDMFLKKFDISKNYIDSDLYIDFKEEYQNKLIKLREILLTFKNNKISDKYPQLTELDFIDGHLNDLEDFYYRLNKYISEDIFNNYFSNLINDYKISQKKKIDEIKDNIKKKDNKINKSQIGKETTKDICANFERKRIFTCRNSQVYNRTKTEDKCLESWGADNIEEFHDLSFDIDNDFESTFNNFYTSIENNITIYNNIIKELKEIIPSIENNILESTKSDDYLFSIKNKSDFALKEIYSDNLINSSYKYYKKILDNNLNNLLTNISDQWVNLFEILKEKAEINKYNFKYSIREFGIMASIYRAIICQNLTKLFYNSVIEHQRTEFNYTINFYYNRFNKTITSIYQFIYNQIPTNDDGLNNIINLRKKQVNNTFNEIFNYIKESLYKALSFDRQIYVLSISPFNFFGMDSLMSENIDNLNSLLTNIIKEINKIKNGKENDEYSLSSRFYSENSQNGLQIEEIYSPITDNIFVSLNLEDFKKLFSDNWIFDQDDLINNLNLAIKNTELEIKKDLLIKKEYYSQQLENEIIKFNYTRGNIGKKVSSNYQSRIDAINLDKKNNITSNVTIILNKIKTHLLNEKARIENDIVLYTNNFTTIKQTIENYKNKILNNINKILKKIIDEVHEYMINNAYTKIVENGLNQYLSEAKKYKSHCESYESLESSHNVGEIIYNIVEDFVNEYNNITWEQIELKSTEFLEKIKKQVGIDEIKKLFENEINPIYNELLNSLKKVAKNNAQSGMGYSDYDLNNIIKGDIDSEVDSIINNIKNILKEGNQIELKEWEILDYDSVDSNLFLSINRDFERFIKEKINFQKNSINTSLKNLIRKNFNLLINNFISSFGKSFFERILKYNQNIKIKTLYQNLKFSLVTSMIYYQILYQYSKSITSMTKDLKIKLYNLNDLDSITEEKNKHVRNLLNEKVNEFIEKTRVFIVEKYTTFLQEDNSIKNSFNEKIIKSIKDNIKDISFSLESDYDNLLKEEFKNKIEDSYSKYMNEQTNDMIQTVDNMKIEIKSLFDDVFTLDVEKVLTESNKKMNETLKSIEEYQEHFKSFSIPEDIINYLINYAKENLLPIYLPIENIINKETKEITINNLNKNSKDFQNLYQNKEFIKKVDEIYSSIKIENIEAIKNKIKELHGLSKYPENLEKEVDIIDKRNLRRLLGEETEDEEVIGKNIEFSYQKLLNISETVRKYINSFEECGEFIKIINKNLEKLNISYKKSQETIDMTYKEEDLYEFINHKLQLLNNISLNYYNEIKHNYTFLRQYIKDSLNEIDNLLKQCVNITYETFEEKFESLSKDIEDFDINENKTEEKREIKKITYQQNNEYTTDANIINLNKKARFKFSLLTDGEGGIKRKKAIATVINEIKPKELTFNVSSSFGTCGKNYQKIDVEFNNVNYTTILLFDTETNKIKLKTFTNFEAYEYTEGKYKIDEAGDNICGGFMGINLCTDEPEGCDVENPITVEAPVKHLVKKKNNNSTKTISI